MFPVAPGKRAWDYMILVVLVHSTTAGRDPHKGIFAPALVDRQCCSWQDGEPFSADGLHNPLCRHREAAKAEGGRT